jgi:hypothetical protein
MYNGAAAMENRMVVLSKIKTTTATGSCNSTSWYISKRSENGTWIDSCMLEHYSK